MDKVAEWERIDTFSEEVNIVTIPAHRHAEKEVVEAKMKELKTRKDFTLYEEVNDKDNKEYLPLGPFLKKLLTIKKLLKQGLWLEAMKKKKEIQTDSPTTAKGTIRIFFASSVMKGWKCMTTDIKAAFVQGRNRKRDVYMKPPIEERKEGKI